MTARDEGLVKLAVALEISEGLSRRAVSGPRPVPSFSDDDYAGLMKLASEYGNLPEITTGNALADMGLYFVPGVGTAMTAMDAARNYADTWSDLKRGKWLSAAGNMGSGILNTGLAALDFVTLGLGGRIVGGGLKAVGRGAKAMSRGAKAGARIGKGVGRADKLFNAGRRMALTERKMRNTAGRWLVNNGGFVGRNMVKRPGRTGLAMGAGLAGTGVVTSVGDAGYEQRRQEAIGQSQQAIQDFYDISSNGPARTPMHSFNVGGQYGHGYAGSHGIYDGGGYNRYPYQSTYNMPYGSTAY